MHRVRIGLTGLAGVFLMVLVAAAFLGLQEAEQPETTVAAGNGPAAMLGNVTAEETPREPLAELGVAPGAATGTEDNASAATPGPATPSP